MLILQKYIYTLIKKDVFTITSSRIETKIAIFIEPQEGKVNVGTDTDINIIWCENIFPGPAFVITNHFICSTKKSWRSVNEIVIFLPVAVDADFRENIEISKTVQIFEIIVN